MNERFNEAWAHGAVEKSLFFFKKKKKKKKASLRTRVKIALTSFELFIFATMDRNWSFSLSATCTKNLPTVSLKFRAINSMGRFNYSLIYKIHECNIKSDPFWPR